MEHSQNSKLLCLGLLNHLASPLCRHFPSLDVFSKPDRTRICQRRGKRSARYFYIHPRERRVSLGACISFVRVKKYFSEKGFAPSDCLCLRFRLTKRAGGAECILRKRGIACTIMGVGRNVLATVADERMAKSESFVEDGWR